MPDISKNIAQTQYFQNLKIEAKKQKKGLWSGENPMAPWTNRNLHRQGTSKKDSFNIEEKNR